MANRANKKKLKAIQGVPLQQCIERGELPRNFHLFDGPEMQDWKGQRRRRPFLPLGKKVGPGKEQNLRTVREY